jgi:ribosomal protein S18 acetylase RimI-like enzyme
MSDNCEMLVPTVRRAVDADIPAIVGLVNIAYEVEDFFVAGTRTEASRIRDLMDEGTFLVLDRTSGGLAASIYVKIDGARGYFGLLSVAPDHQNTGLGRRLVAVAEALSEAEGCSTMDLQVVNLRTELPPWYRSLGYTECGTEPFPDTPPPKLPCHFILMSKPLQ